MLHCGIDEAGLGPLLGPLVVASCAGNLENLPKLLAGLGLQVADSKQIYRGNLARLEQLALSLYLGGAYQRERPLMQDLLPEPQLEWYRGRQVLPLAASWPAVRRQADKLAAALERQGSSLQLSALVLAEHEFNRLIARLDNKNLVLRELVGWLLQDFARKSGAPAMSPASCTVDRLGGLKYYRPWLGKIFPGWEIATQHEGPDRSEYRLANVPNGRANALYLRFWVKGDERDILCAIASIWAKYCRELRMCQFNRYWQEKFPGIPATSGYYRDAKIFLDFLQQKLGNLPPDLWRSR